VEGSSRNARDTSKARGTSCYRAPELVKEEASFTNKVDMWSLGCILYELATGTIAFRSDFHTFEYSTEDSVIQFSVPDLSAFLQHHASENIQELLHRDRERRPNATSASQMFSTYCWILSMSRMQTIVDSELYPSYQEWKQLAKSHPDQHDFLNQVADMYERNGNCSVAIDIRQDLIRLGLNRLATEYWERGNYNALIHIYEDAIDEEPLDFWHWHYLFEAHIAKDGFDGAIAACKQGITKHPDNPCPMMELTNLYTAKGDYHMAITIYMGLSSDWKGWSQLENVLSKAMNENLSLLHNKMEAMNGLGRR
jgi:serine/threonine protein kinase